MDYKLSKLKRCSTCKDFNTPLSELPCRTCKDRKERERILRALRAHRNCNVN